MSLTFALVVLLAAIVGTCGGIVLAFEVWHARRVAGRIRVLTALARHGPLTSAELAAALGLDDDVAAADRVVLDLHRTGALVLLDGRWWLAGETAAE